MTADEAASPATAVLESHAMRQRDQAPHPRLGGGEQGFGFAAGEVSTALVGGEDVGELDQQECFALPPGAKGVEGLGIPGPSPSISK